MTRKPIVLIFAGYYLPGNKAGGPIRSLQNLVNRLSDQFDLRIVTSDRDLGDVNAYVGIEHLQECDVNGVPVIYLERARTTINTIKEIIKEMRPNLIYLNSLFDPCFTINFLLARRLARVDPGVPVLIAPRGELASGALVLKKWKKRAFLVMARLLGLYRKVFWHASSLHEEQDIRQKFKAPMVYLAPNLLRVKHRSTDLYLSKTSGKLKLFCVARIARNKNIDGALHILSKIKSNVDFDLYGPCEDSEYWRTCKQIIDSMPANVHVEYHGEIAHDDLEKAYKKSHIFFLPTCGENFGHSIMEALDAGKPLIISDTTPWRDLSEKKIGWDLPLQDKIQFIKVIEQSANLDDEQYRQMVYAVEQFMIDRDNNDVSVELTTMMFFSVIGVDKKYENSF